MAWSRLATWNLRSVQVTPCGIVAVARGRDGKLIYANPAYAEAAGPATILVAACVVVTAILVPIATAWASRRFGGGEAEAETGSPEVAAPAQPVAGR